MSSFIADASVSPFIRECRCCGCTEHNACITEDGPCHWVLLDVFQPTGICSACAEQLGWHQGLLCSGFMEEARAP